MWTAASSIVTSCCQNERSSPPAVSGAAAVAPVTGRGEPSNSSAMTRTSPGYLVRALSSVSSARRRRRWREVERVGRDARNGTEGKADKPPHQAGDGTRPPAPSVVSSGAGGRSPTRAMRSATTGTRRERTRRRWRGRRRRNGAPPPPPPPPRDRSMGGMWRGHREGDGGRRLLEGRGEKENGEKWACVFLSPSPPSQLFLFSRAVQPPTPPTPHIIFVVGPPCNQPHRPVPHGPVRDGLRPSPRSRGPRPVPRGPRPVPAAAAVPRRAPRLRRRLRQRPRRQAPLAS
jgi:hypothetical protein